MSDDTPAPTPSSHPIPEAAWEAAAGVVAARRNVHTWSADDIARAAIAAAMPAIREALAREFYEIRQPWANAAAEYLVAVRIVRGTP